jgi:mRNA interferase MazF
MAKYLPKRQEIVWVDFHPSSDNELSGRHPAVVLSNEKFSKVTGLTVVLPITHARNNRLNDLFIPLTKINRINGYINPLQISTLSIRGRKVEPTGEMVSNYDYARATYRLNQIIQLY